MAKLSKRLNIILEALEPRDNLYDICCDHGELGIAAANRSLAKNIYLIDQVESIIESLKIKLKATDIPNGVAIIPICEDASKIPKKVSNSNLVLAGIGENTAIEILEKYEVDQTCEIVLCIHSDNFLLRKFLIENGLKTVDESIFEDKGKLYELIKISKMNGEQTTIVGTKMWDKNNPAAKQLLTKRMFHLERRVSHGNDGLTKICLNKLRQIALSIN